MRKACRAAARELRRGRPAADAVVAAIAVLEDNPACNAGRGSNLTMQGTVECDASLMTDAGAFGGVGAVPGLAHPVKAAALLAAESLEKQPCGLVPPLMLVGDGARKWALARGLEEDCDQAALITPAAHRQWQRYRAMYNAEVARRAKPCQGAAESGRLAPLCDTVGAVVVSCEGRCAAGVSSGGIALKRQGRVGEAAIHGAGCWAERWAGAGAASERCSVGVSTTGVGERVMVHALSRSAGARLRPREESGAAPTVGSCLAVLLRDTVCTGPPPRDAGIIAARATCQDDSVRVEVGAAHSGQSMAIATLKGGSAAVADESTASFMINTSESIKEWSLGLSWPLHRPHA